jgi:rhamnose utilization protein RhaD (predicted bifunctional aldolase and dehydrogenase)
MAELSALKKLSARVGADPLLVQAAGGNTSLKQDGVMWIKASGTWLRDAETKDIFVPVDHARLLAALKIGDPACETCTDFVRTDLNATGLRPSIETTVHALMPQSVVVHVHCVNTIAWAIRADVETLLTEKLTAFKWAFIPYARPGLFLADAITQRLRGGVDVLVLGNHGLVVAADTVAEAHSLLSRVVSALQLPVRKLIVPHHDELSEICLGTDYFPATWVETHALATDGLALGLANGFVFYPDHVVFLGIGVATKINSGAPLVAIADVGVVIHKHANPAVEPMGRCLADVMRRVNSSDHILAISQKDVGSLTNWNAEKYRQDLRP